MRKLGFAILIMTCGAGLVSAQGGIERITFDEAIRRATMNNPTVAQAAAGIMRAEALLQQARSSSLPSVSATFGLNVIDPVTKFDGIAIVPRTQTQTAGSVNIPILTPVAWAQRAQASDQVFVSQQTQVDIRKQVAVATAQSFLAIIANRRVLELNERSRDNAKAHFDYADQRFQGGIGSRLNMLRAQVELTGDETRVEEAALEIRRAQEALGVLVAADGPVDAADEPMFDEATGDQSVAIDQRTDIKLLDARQKAAERVVSDSWKDRLPSVVGVFAPQYLAPSGLFAQPRSWRASALFSVPLFDGGFRTGQKNERIALLDTIKFQRVNTERQATSEVRTAREAVASSARAFAVAQMAASQANEVVQITDVAFREGATTNIEVIDAQRSARDAETQAAIEEDALRRARLDLLVALGRFPRPLP
jgi:outer membrane protein TolC